MSVTGDSINSLLELCGRKELHAIKGLTLDGELAGGTGIVFKISSS